MKKILYLAVIACITVFASCDKVIADPQADSQTGDEKETVELNGNLYGIWALISKSEANPGSEDSQSSYTEDYTPYHFYLVLSEFPLPHAVAKKGSLSAFDLSDVDVDAVRFTYDRDAHQITFSKTIWLSADLLTHSMRLSGRFDIAELSETRLVIQQKEFFSGKTIAYYYTRQ